MSVDSTTFVQLNHGWNAQPNAPGPRVAGDGDDLVLRFALNSFQFQTFTADDEGFIRFHSCSRYRFGPVNDEGWYRGQCRFSRLAPKWGEFYEVIGDFKEDGPDVVWKPHASPIGEQRNFLFYFRDNAFECSAQDWSFDQTDQNALRRFSAEDRPEG